MKFFQLSINKMNFKTIIFQYCKVLSVEFNYNDISNYNREYPLDNFGIYWTN